MQAGYWTIFMSNPQVPTNSSKSSALANILTTSSTKTRTTQLICSWVLSYEYYVIIHVFSYSYRCKFCLDCYAIIDNTNFYILLWKLQINFVNETWLRITMETKFWVCLWRCFWKYLTEEEDLPWVSHVLLTMNSILESSDKINSSSLKLFCQLFLLVRKTY